MARLRITSGGGSLETAQPETEVALADWRAGARPPGHVALIVPNTEDIRSIAGDLAAIGAVILEFPHFADGRAYSQARLLREELRFAGEIRARGDVLADQALFMARAGFDHLEIGAQDPARFRQALAAYSVFYQSAADDAPPAARLRAGRRKAA
jgi:uncharacterized protein (DUF934 family)